MAKATPNITVFDYTPIDDLPIEEQCKTRFDENPELREQYPTLDAYLDSVRADGPVPAPESKTTFRLRSLSTIQKMEVTDIINNGGGSAVYWRLVRHGLVGWENFSDESGRPVLFADSMTDNINRLPPALVIELGMKILASSSLTEKARKN